ncbi:hypothetical protein I8752_12790 [Nostocaceae cyanobacterium CENA369]|uniref:Uncharacterized protein n=1 Tax=Dendronalium phyllosphericum CENA369 TaxID=1725256 RepID=A0A8J7I7H9_9NOST|nr:hypothetical protein [Dendronalium phyllosphericum]MBH8573882.1 hypothetical protein [Dendronalium phyllosphericum CENA369]
MKVAVQQEDLELLARTLQEQFLAEVPSGEVFQIKCAVNKDELMILTQHPIGVTVDIQQIFAVLEEVLQSLPTYREQQVQCFLRISGDKLPYSKRFLTIKQVNRGAVEAEEAMFSSFSSSPSSSSLLFPPQDFAYTDENQEEELEDPFDPLADTPDLLTSGTKRRQIKPILLGAALVGILVLGSGVYLLTRPCVMFECKQIQAAEKLKTESRQQISRAQSENELVTVQKQLEATSADLTTIPGWSPHYQQAEELKLSLSGQSEKISQVVKALQVAATAGQKTQTPANSLEELQARQHLWRQAIAPLESINPNSELYGFVQPNLMKYRVNLQTVNQQLLAQEKWLKKLTAAKAVASVATQREANAKSLNDWQKVQSTWQIAINALIVIPQNSPASQEAQKLLLDYKPKLAAARDRATKEQLAAKSYQQALTTAKQAKVYEQQNQWRAAVIYWTQALQTAKQISQDSTYYNQAQSLTVPYSAALQQAQEKLQIDSSWQQTRTDLNKTCTSEIRICTFTINDKGIIVSLTPDYQQVLQSSLSNSNPQNPSPVVGVTNHWQTLQDALAVISDNANLPLLIYDTQGQGLYTHIPGG